ncbi:MAG: hypothetical protein BGO14_03635 [Chlamydiales bacterium 38-26]|nr:hypothetical protein [Chlamydiales bacterium]OJV09425.1 MAG: hypothetical protein BGO14_03635 [Chlamydiales bacterium 38-26]
MHKSKKRAFFAFDTHAPWPETLPSGRLLKAEDRHMTLAFLGEVDESQLLHKLKEFPPPPFQVGLAGFFSACVFLPPLHPNVVAWNIQWLDEDKQLIHYRAHFLEWLKSIGFHAKETNPDWLCHVTLSRKPFEKEQWLHSFTPLPFFISNIHLYESLGHSAYTPLWTYPLISPFEEIEHTADIAYLIKGENLGQIYLHALAALAFRFPAFLAYKKPKNFENLDDVIIGLNDVISETDAHIGCPFKAISFHGQLEQDDSILKWEMIVDV